MRGILTILLMAFATQVGADGVKSWKVVSSSVFSVLPTWPGYTDSGYGAPLGTTPEGTGFAISEHGHIIYCFSRYSKGDECICEKSKR